MRCLSDIAILILVSLPSGCALETAPTRSPAPQETRPTTISRALDAKQTERVQWVMMPLVRAATNPRRLNETRVGVIDVPKINDANAGGEAATASVFFVHALGDRRQNRCFGKVGMKGGVCSDSTGS